MATITVTSQLLETRGDIDVTVDSTYIGRSPLWWDSNWSYRRYLTITAPASGLEVRHPITVNVSKDPIGRNKMRSDFQDIQVLQLLQSTPEKWRLVPKDITAFETTVRVRFNLAIALSANGVSDGEYFIYYGNSDLVGDPVVGSYTYQPYPIAIDTDSSAVTYTRPGRDWEDGVASNYGAKATVEFIGEDIQIYSTKGADWGIAEVQLDDGSWTQVDLFASATATGQVVYTTSGLSEAKHTLRIRTTGQKHPSSSDNKINFEKFTYKKHGLAVDVREEANSRLMWSTGIGGK